MRAGARGRCIAVALGAGAALGSADDSRAAERAARLQVTRGLEAADCPDTEALRQRIASLVGDSVWAADGAAADVSIEIRIDRGPEGLRALVRAGAGDRELVDSGPGCEALADAIALTTALVLDPDHVGAPRPPPADPGPPAVTPAPVWVPVVEPDRPDPPDDEPRPEWTFDAGVLQSAGLLGSSAVGLSLAAGRHLAGPFSGVLGVVWAPSDEIDLGPGKVDMSLVAVHAAGCAGAPRAAGPVGLAGCAGAGLGLLRGQGEGYDEDVTADQTWAAVSATGIADGKIAGPVGFFAALTLWVPVVERRFVVENAAAEHVMSPVALAGGIGLRLYVY